MFKSYKYIKIIYLSILFFVSPCIASSALSEDWSVPGGAVRLIQRFESFSPGVYKDSGGNPTIGYGHLVTRGESYEGKTLSEPQALRLLVSDIHDRANIKPLVKVKIDPWHEDALTSLCFNIGLGNFRKADVLTTVNTKGCDAAREYFGHWRRVTVGGSKVISTGLIKRRFAELFVFAGEDLDPSSDLIPSEQWGIDPMPITDENWGRLSSALREEAVEIYKECTAE
ncbi:MAG: lysozyme [Alphaproteobacteria bacterium]|nr:MAG: lysozyme [Alphaproteobacteria bacterium]